MTPPRTYPHWVAVATIAAIATFYGGGFATMPIALRAGLPVGAVLSLGLVLATLGLFMLVYVPTGRLSGWNRGDFDKAPIRRQVPAHP